MNMKTLSNKYQKGLWACIVLLFGFIIYRRYVIQRIYYPMFQEGLAVQGDSTVEQTGNKTEVVQGGSTVKQTGVKQTGNKIEVVQGGSMVEQTGNKIELLLERGKGQDKKMKVLNEQIDTVNKELDRKLNNSRSS